MIDQIGALACTVISAGVRLREAVVSQIASRLAPVLVRAVRRNWPPEEMREAVGHLSQRQRERVRGAVEEALELFSDDLDASDVVYLLRLRWAVS